MECPRRLNIFNFSSIGGLIGGAGWGFYSATKFAVEGLSEALSEIQTRTASMLQYVGEWHSHPDGYSTRPSSDDKRAFEWLVELMEIDGYPGVMRIEGQDRSAWYLGTME